MNKILENAGAEIGDTISLKIQSLRQSGKIKDEQPLIKIDYQKEASLAPFQFDIAKAMLHRTDCPIIANEDRTAFYGVWKPKKKDFELACGKCMPVPIKGKKMDKDSKPLDIVFGFLSFIDQFGSVIIERGREYRGSERGKQISKSVDKMITELNHQQKEVLDVVLSSFDGLLNTINSITEEIAPNNNGKNGKKSKTLKRKKSTGKKLDKQEGMQ